VHTQNQIIANRQGIGAVAFSQSFKEITTTTNGLLNKVGFEEILEKSGGNPTQVSWIETLENKPAQCYREY
jgi:hypothetical protein